MRSLPPHFVHDLRGPRSSPSLCWNNFFVERAHVVPGGRQASTRASPPPRSGASDGPAQGFVAPHLYPCALCRALEAASEPLHAAANGTDPVVREVQDRSNGCHSSFARRTLRHRKSICGPDRNGGSISIPRLWPSLTGLWKTSGGWAGEPRFH